MIFYIISFFIYLIIYQILDIGNILSSDKELLIIVILLCINHAIIGYKK